MKVASIQIKISDHAKKRFKQRVKSENVSIRDFCRNAVLDGEYIGLIIGDDGNLAHCYLYKDYKVLIADYTVVSIVPKNKTSDSCKNIKSKLHNVYKVELNKLIRKSKSYEKYILELKLEAEIEIAELNYRIHKTKSPSIKMVCEARIIAIKESIKEYEEELHEMYKSKSQISNYVLATV